MLFIKVNGIKERDMEEAFKFGLMDRFIKVTGWTIWQMAKEG